MSNAAKKPALLLALLLAAPALAQPTFRYFYNGNRQLFRVLDSSGNLVEYDRDPAGNTTAIRRSVLAAGTLAILNVTPPLGQPGATVTIYGQNFSPNASGDTVSFNGAAATVVAATTTAIVVTVPAGATAGPVSITVNGVTVDSGSLHFAIPDLPSITSISPPTGFLGQTVAVTVQGTSLDNSTFELTGALNLGITNVNIASSTQATFTVTIGQVGGNFTLVATNDYGSSSTTPAEATTFRVYQAAGNNYSAVRLSAFNTYSPPGTNPVVPAGKNASQQKFSTFNSNLPTGGNPSVPAGSNAVEQKFSTFNSNLPTGGNPFLPAGSNQTFQLLSTDNSMSGAPLPPAISITPLRISRGDSPDGGTAPNLTSAVAGQTVRIEIDSPGGFLPELQFKVNGAVLASSATGSLKTYFTIPYGVASLSLQAAGTTAHGAPLESEPRQIAVVESRDLAISGRVLDAFGRPAAGTALEWQANGLAADYYGFQQPLSAIPDLSGLQPARTSYVSALNMANPQQVFGLDPLGVGLGPNYAARFHGILTVPATGDYQFQWNAHRGARLAIDGRTVLEGDHSGGATLAAGAHEMEVIYYESGGALAVQLLWTPPGGAPEVVPPSALSVRTTAGSGADGRFLLTVPAALSGVRVSAKGQGSVVLDQ